MCTILPIFQAADHGYTKIVKVLAPLTDNSNAPSKLSKSWAILQTILSKTTKKQQESHTRIK